MKYCFCYDIKKKGEIAHSEIEENYIIFSDNDGNEANLVCGPWRDTIDEIKKDEELFKNNRDVFYNLINKR